MCISRAESSPLGFVFPSAQRLAVMLCGGTHRDLRRKQLDSGGAPSVSPVANPALLHPRTLPVEPEPGADPARGGPQPGALAS